MITSQNVMKVIDVLCTDVTEETRAYLSDKHTVYRDQVMQEHLHEISDDVTCEDNEEYLAELSTTAQAEIAELVALAAKHNAGYVRFVTY